MGPELQTIGKWLVLVGMAVLILGVILLGLSRISGFEKFPGTLRLQWGNLTCVVPILVSIVLSIVLTLLLNLFARFFNR